MTKFILSSPNEAICAYIDLAIKYGTLFAFSDLLQYYLYFTHTFFSTKRTSMDK